MELLSLNKLTSIIGLKRNFIQEVASKRNEYYRPFTRKEAKPDGSVKLRVINQPLEPLKSIQLRIHQRLLGPYSESLPPFATGGVKGRGLIDNLLPHINRECLVALDIRDCFPSVTARHVYRALRKHLGCSTPVAKLLTRLTVYKNHLPQGSAVSTDLCNLVLLDAMSELYQECLRRDLEFRQYIDDIGISGSYRDAVDFISVAITVFKRHGFSVQREKLVIMPKSARQAVTGGVVNSRLSVGRKKVGKYRQRFLAGRFQR